MHLDIKRNITKYVFTCIFDVFRFKMSFTDIYFGIFNKCFKIWIDYPVPSNDTQYFSFPFQIKLCFPPRLSECLLLMAHP